MVSQLKDCFNEGLSPMNVTINGKAEEITESTLAALCKRFLDHPHTIATAVNGQFVSVNDRPEYSLKDGDKVEILSPRQGG